MQYIILYIVGFLLGYTVTKYILLYIDNKKIKQSNQIESESYRNILSNNSTLMDYSHFFKYSSNTGYDYSRNMGCLTRFELDEKMREEKK